MTMTGLRATIGKKIENKQREINSLRQQKREIDTKIREGEAYISAHQETLKMLAREDSTSGERNLRVGSSMAKACDAIKKAGKPLHVDEILKALGRPNDKKNRTSLSGSLAHYVRKSEIFTRTAPNTFGLTEFENQETGDLFSNDDQDDSADGSLDGIRENP